MWSNSTDENVPKRLIIALALLRLIVFELCSYNCRHFPRHGVYLAKCCGGAFFICEHSDMRYEQPYLVTVEWVVASLTLSSSSDILSATTVKHNTHNNYYIHSQEKNNKVSKYKYAQSMTILISSLLRGLEIIHESSA